MSKKMLIMILACIMISALPSCGRTKNNNTGESTTMPTESSVTDYGNTELFLEASQDWYASDSDESLVFTISFDTFEDVYLVNSQNIESPSLMYDDGTHGDETAGDNVYSLEYTSESNVAGSADFYVLIDQNESNHVLIFFYSDVDENSIADAEVLGDEIQNIDAEYQNEEGYIDKSDVPSVLDTVEANILEWMDEGLVLDYQVDDYCITYTFYDGITHLYMPEIEGVDAVGDDVTIEIYMMDPLLYTYGSDLYSYFDAIEESANLASDELDNVTFCGRYINEDVTLETIKNFGENQIILWHGHGIKNSYGPALKMRMGTSLWEWYTDSEIRSDCWNKRILYNDLSKCYMITGAYISEYCGSLDGSFIYLGTCQSGKSDELANAFLEKGATAVIGNTKIILTTYNTQLMTSVMEHLVSINPTSGQPYTLGEALQAAKDIYGEDDGEEGAVAVIFGGTAAENYQIPLIIEENLANILELENHLQSEGSVPDADIAFMIDDTWGEISAYSWDETYYMDSFDLGEGQWYAECYYGTVSVYFLFEGAENDPDAKPMSMWVYTQAGQGKYDQVNLIRDIKNGMTVTEVESCINDMTSGLDISYNSLPLDDEEFSLVDEKYELEITGDTIAYRIIFYYVNNVLNMMYIESENIS